MIDAPATTVLDLVGNTPLVQLRRFDAGPCELFVKLEYQNPGGSIKDRIARSMIEAAERDGKVRPGGMLVEATAGNTGLALALVASQKGYRLTVVIPDKMSREKVRHLRAMGATVEIARGDVGAGHPQHYMSRAERIAGNTPGAFFVNQFANPANPLAHEATTGPEVWRQAGGRLDAVVCGVGSGGTLTGLSRYFSHVAPDVEVVLADPVGSVLADYVRTGRIGTAGSWLVEGIGEDFLPPVADLGRVRRAYAIPDAESVETGRLLLKHEGILAGSSTGTLVAAALRYCREQSRPKRVVTFACDTGGKYLSKMFSDAWVAEQGVGAPGGPCNPWDLVASRHDGNAASVGPDDPLSAAYGRMRQYGVSHLAVLDGGALVGTVDESDLLPPAHDRRGEAAGGFDRPVRDVMTTNVQTVPRTVSIDDLLPIFDAGRVAVVSDDAGFHGLITRVDVLNYLRKQHREKRT